MFSGPSLCGEVQLLLKMQTIERVFRVDRKDIHYIRPTIESFDGMAVVTTLDPYEASIKISISPGCEYLVLELLDSLVEKEGLYIKELTRDL